MAENPNALKHETLNDIDAAKRLVEEARDWTWREKTAKRFQAGHDALTRVRNYAATVWDDYRREKKNREKADRELEVARYRAALAGDILLGKGTGVPPVPENIWGELTGSPDTSDRIHTTIMLTLFAATKLVCSQCAKGETPAHIGCNVYQHAGENFPCGASNIHALAAMLEERYGQTDT